MEEEGPEPLFSGKGMRAFSATTDPDFFGGRSNSTGVFFLYVLCSTAGRSTAFFRGVFGNTRAYDGVAFPDFFGGTRACTGYFFPGFFHSAPDRTSVFFPGSFCNIRAYTAWFFQAPFLSLLGRWYIFLGLFGSRLVCTEVTCLYSFCSTHVRTRVSFAGFGSLLGWVLDFVKGWLDWIDIW
jgi:hypothetical protein